MTTWATTPRTDASCTIDLTNVAVIGKLVPSGDDIIGLSGLTLVGASSALRVGRRCRPTCGRSSGR